MLNVDKYKEMTFSRSRNPVIHSYHFIFRKCFT
ncbi:hypothetical protein FWK35_00013614 [Aphis craccivora]|uniref:Uncharacterized protein n=1 Tax=Aphis craccivora TaxID=307492 RepID=A0A6G0YGL7_APHCR|nr:hypothetical protein FWK35_00013614 [Aphis craccivora]